MDSETLPQYLRIALDIASRIASGEIAEQQKIAGRSLLSSEYGVSPETIRKAMRPLADMKVVEVREKCGIVILSADNARRYLDAFRGRTEQHALHAELRSLLAQYQKLGRKMHSVADRLLSAQELPLPAERSLPNYEVTVSPGSDKIGCTIGSLRFWQATGATIVAIRRKQNTLLSPGPYAELYGGDVVVFVGAPESAATVRYFLNADAAAPAAAPDPA